MDKNMVDDPDKRHDRKSIDNPAPRPLPNREQRRKIAKRRGVFKHNGLWPYINNRSSNRAKGDNPDDNQS